MSDSDSSPSPAHGGSPLHPPSSGPSEAAEPTPDPAADPAADPSDQPAKKKRKRTKKKKAGAEPAAPDAKDPSTLATPSTLFVEGIPFKITEEAFSSFLASQGCPPTSMRLPVWQDSGNLRGFGHVVFASAAIAKKATDEIGGKNFPALMNRYLTFSPANAPKAPAAPVEREQPSGCKSVFIKNLPYDATEAIISDVFSVFGKIVPGGVRLPLVNPGAAEGEHSFGKIKGFGYVTFKEPEHALACVNKARKPYGVEVSGRPIMCDYDEKGEAGVKASFRTQDGKYWGKEFGEDKNKGGAQKRKGGPKL